MWADDTPDDEHNRKAPKQPRAEVVKIDKERPPLPKSDISLNALTDQITQPTNMEGTNDNTPMDSDCQATPNEDEVHTKTTPQENRGNPSQTKTHKHAQIEKETESMGQCSDSEDMLIEEMATGIMQQDKEGTQDDVRISPKRPKKMKVEKMGEPQKERSRSSTRRTVLKDRKT